MLTRERAEHVVRAASAILNTDRVVVVGSATALLVVHRVGGRMTMTNEVDLYPEDPSLQQDAVFMLEAIGEGSLFARTHGYFVDGVGPETAALPDDWRHRAHELHPPAVPGVTVIVPDLDDIALSKVVAWRQKDQDWLQDAVLLSIVDPARMRERVGRLPARVGPMVIQDLGRRLQELERFDAGRAAAGPEPVEARTPSRADRNATSTALKGLAEPTLVSRVRATVDALADPRTTDERRRRLEDGLAIARAEYARRGLAVPAWLPEER